MMDKMTYEFKTHSLYYKECEINVPIFSLAIDTLEMIYELSTGKLMGVQGFFPLVKANHCTINLPKWESGDYFMDKIDLSDCRENMVYDLIKKIPEMQHYFEELLIKYDKEQGVIQIGQELAINEVGIKVSDNIMCGFDINSNLKCVYIIPTEIIM